LRRGIHRFGPDEFRHRVGSDQEKEDAVTSVIIGAPTSTAEITALADELCAVRLQGDPLVCDVASLLQPDCATVEALARLQLAARRLQRQICLRDASRELVELVTLAGLADVLPCEGGSRVQVGRQAEEREESRGVQEERDAGDATV
jgi:ABC-type transporter Mla MlaB component